MSYRSLEAGEPQNAAKEMDKVRVDLAPVAKRTLIAFWILGLCNNYGYVVMLSAAHDIIQNVAPDDDGTSSGNSTGRECSQMSTGAVLLADIIPALAIKIAAPFFPLAIQMATVIGLNVLGFILVSQAKTILAALSGVVAIAFGSGLGEVSVLAYLAFYKNRSAISFWSSGTGGAGFLGALSYMLLAYLCSPGNRSQPLLVFLVVPAIMAVSFWLLLERPVMDTDNSKQVHKNMCYDDNITDVCQEVNSRDPITRDSEQQLTLSDKVRVAPKVLKYMLPFASVYLFEYFINQGLHELIYFDPSMLSRGNQYVSYQLCYQIGVFISRSSVNWFRVRNTWLLAILQGINVAVFTTEAIYAYLPHISVIWILIIWEGLLGGCSYVNTYDRINREVPTGEREFFMSMNSFGDAVGISLAGVIAIPVHNVICSLPVYGK